MISARMFNTLRNKVSASFLYCLGTALMTLDLIASANSGSFLASSINDCTTITIEDIIVLILTNLIPHVKTNA